MKRTIKLTENDLHNIIKESVERIINEGQGWDYFKNMSKKAWSGDYDDEINQHYQNKNRDEEREFNKNFIKTGTANPSWNNDTHYDPEDPITSSGNKFGRWSKPINKGLTGKMGRALGMGAAKAAVGARHAYNKIRGAYNN